MLGDPDKAGLHKVRNLSIHNLKLIYPTLHLPTPLNQHGPPWHRKGPLHSIAFILWEFKYLSQGSAQECVRAKGTTILKLK